MSKTAQCLEIVDKLGRDKLKTILDKILRNHNHKHENELRHIVTEKMKQKIKRIMSRLKSLRVLAPVIHKN